MQNIKPATSRAHSTLRRRIHILEKAHKPVVEEGTGMSRDRNLSGDTVLPHSDYESDSGDSDDRRDGLKFADLEKENDAQHVELDANVAGSPVPGMGLKRSAAIASHSLPRDRSWYEFDLTVVAALASPIGNWLTGGDHVKNAILVLFLLFYLHQIIEGECFHISCLTFFYRSCARIRMNVSSSNSVHFLVPWTLYHKARPRGRPSHIRSPRTSSEERYCELASSELRIAELSLLSVSVLSPFIGAYLIRLVSSAVLGNDSFSWFSISLFVLATGVRPWSHVTERITARVTDLHDIIHYPAHDSSIGGDIRSEVEDLKTQVRKLEESISLLTRKGTTRTQEIYNYVDDALDIVEKTIRRNEKKQEEMQHAWEDSIRKNSRPRPSPVQTTGRSSPSSQTPLRKLTEQFSNVASSIFPLSYFHAATVDVPKKSGSDDGQQSPPSSAIRYSSRSPSAPEGLQTIAEEDSPEIHFLTMSARLFLRFAYLVLFPLRSVSRMVLGHS